ncbi:hypothetical protein [Mycolicibacterium sarraceniae]|nr:hypothetical protein [Mycolicibacterium sarraceniae]
MRYSISIPQFDVDDDSVRARERVLAGLPPTSFHSWAYTKKAPA